MQVSKPGDSEPPGTSEGVLCKQHVILGRMEELLFLSGTLNFIKSSLGVRSHGEQGTISYQKKFCHSQEHQIAFVEGVCAADRGPSHIWFELTKCCTGKPSSK